MGVHEWWSRLRGTLRSGADEAEVDEELAFHLDMAIQRNLARGLSAEDARRDALLRFGGLDRTREAARDVQRSRWLEDFGQDVRYALRTLARAPAFALAAVFTLALGMGANTAIFSVLEAVLLRPLPYAQPAQLVSFDSDLRYDNYRAWTEDARSFRSTGAYTYSLANVTSGAEPVRVWTLAVTSSLLPTLGVAPFLGRNFGAEDDRDGALPRVLLRYGFWQTHFAGDRSVVGRTIDVSGGALEVIGILPPELEFPPPARLADGSMPRVPDVWLGVGWLPDLHTRGGFQVMARLAPGSSAESATAELNGIMRRVSPDLPANLQLLIRDVTDTVVAPLRPAILAFAAAVALVLLIACANLSSLLLARLAGRQRELALRRALGARAGRIVRQILTESAVLATGGVSAGVAVAYVLLRVLLLLAPPELARVQDASLSGRVLVFTLAVGVLTVLLIGVLPALRVISRDPRNSISSARGALSERSTGRAHAWLVAGEVAFAIVLLVGGGLLLRSFSTLARVSPGFDANGLITADLLIPPDRYRTRTDVLHFFDRLEERLSARPGISSASAIDRVPYGPSWSGLGFQIVGRPETAGTGQARGSNTAARPGYFRTMGIPILAGREFLPSDATESLPVVVIGKAVADKYWPGVSPLGERIEVFGKEREIVGVAGDVRQRGPLTPVELLVYLPQSQDITTRRMMTVVVRTKGSADDLLPGVRAEIRALDAQLPITNLRSFGALRSERTASQRFNALLVASFAALAVLLATIGIYGVLSFVVAQRTREIGVRMALGASRSGVLVLFLTQALRSASAGAALGVTLALVLTRFLQTMLFGITPTDLLTYAGVLALVAALALFAAWLPARRAARTQPAVALAGE